jgi:predicted Zn-dependent peptidase
VAQKIHVHTLPNGLTLIAEEMPWLESAAVAFLTPSGVVYDPPTRLGLANFTCDMVQRGAGTRNSRQFIEALEGLGVDHSASVSLSHTSYSGSMLADNLLPAVELYADLLRRPHLPADQIEESRQVCFQELRAAEDDLAHRAIERVRQLQYPAPWGRTVPGEAKALTSISLEDVRGFFQLTYRPQDAIVSAAGKLDWSQLRDHVERHFGDWNGAAAQPIVETPAPGGHDYLHHDSQQTHIAVAYPNVPYRHEDYYQARAAVGVLSDGMSSRLFTEIREKRGLCYTVYASSHTLRDQGAVLCYSGTSTERAQETLDVLIQELTRLAAGIEQSELDRLKARIKSALVMQQESSSTRSVSVAIDWYHLGRVRTLAEVAASVDGLSAASINGFLRRHPPRDFKIVSLGAQPLEVPVEVS